MARKSKKKRPARGRNIWDFLTDSLRESMRRGQLGMLMVGLLCALVIFKLPPEAVERLVDQIVEGAFTLRWGSYLLNILLSLALVFYSRSIRVRASREQQRIGSQKTLLQEQLAGHSMGTSD